MLKLCDIQKTYLTGENQVTALRGVSVEFRKNEFVSILGPSGCGKTTLLNIIGGLDHYTSGDLIINGVSTKEYTDRDWDLYRNHSIGFVFQSYNLIPHQTVLSNVELALTLSGVDKAERRRRAREALELVGLADQLSKKPNQMSGGQMQRVAIARALVNDPDILLADEPTGALDSKTSVQVMELLKKVAEDRLVIMVTHNPDLAEQYSTRIIRVQDGAVLDDSAPYSSEQEAAPTSAAPEAQTEVTAAQKAKKREKKADRRAKKSNSMSLFTAFSLSLNNLLTKKARTILTSFAGSIGIIGIALILSLSTGINAFIDQVQEDTLSSYPIQLEAQTADLGAFIQTLAGAKEKRENYDPDRIYANTIMQDMVNTTKTTGITTNNLKKFKAWMEDEKNGMTQYLSAVQYQYGVDLNVYAKNGAGETVQVNPSTVFEQIFSSGASGASSASGASGSMSGLSSMMSMGGGADIWTQMIEGPDGEPVSQLIKDQYILVGDGSRWPEKYDEIVLIVDANNQINDLYLYSLGLKDQSKIPELMKKNFESSETVDTSDESWSIADLLDLRYRLILPTDKFQKNEETGVWEDKSDNADYMALKTGAGVELKVVGVIKPNPDAVASSLNGAVGYTAALTDYYLDAISESEIVKEQLAAPETDLFLGLPFLTGDEVEPDEKQKAKEIKDYIKSLSVGEQAELYRKVAANPSEEELAQMVENQMAQLSTREQMEAAVLSSMAQSSGMDATTIKMYLSKMSDDDLREAIRKSVTEALTAQYGEDALKKIDDMTDAQKSAALKDMLTWKGEKDLAGWYDAYLPPKYSESTLEDNLSVLGMVDRDDPTAILLYAATFENKDAMSALIDDYNHSVDEKDAISYTDFIAIFISSFSTIINIIAYVLMAFVSISLVVSSIMIGIITYISVLERIKEIGILRALGASKKDIARLFNAEALTVGFVAGLIGVLLTVVLNVPISLIVRRLADINTLTATLPVAAAVILVAISMFLTFIAGRIPSRIAAKKDPVEALRTE